MFHAIGSAEIAQVNLPVAVLIWLMIIPMLVKVDFAALATVVGVLIEVAVMLSVVMIVNATKGWYERGAAVRRHRRAPSPSGGLGRGRRREADCLRPS